MKLNDEQFKALAALEPYFATAVNASWARHPGQANLQVIHSIYTSVTNSQVRLNGSCQSCILHLLQDCGKIYFADKQARMDLENEKRAVAISKKAMETKKVAVKTKKLAQNANK